MADQTISSLTQNPSITGIEEIAIEKDGLNYKDTFDQLKDYILDGSILDASNGLTKNGSDVKLGGTLTETTSILGDSKMLQIGTPENPFGYGEVMSNNGIYFANSVEPGGSGFGGFIDIRSYSNDPTQDSSIILQAGTSDTGNISGVPVVPHNGQIQFNVNGKNPLDNSFSVKINGDTNDSNQMSLGESSTNNALFSGFQWLDNEGVCVRDDLKGKGLSYNNRINDESNIGPWGTEDDHIASEARIIEGIKSVTQVLVDSTPRTIDGTYSDTTQNVYGVGAIATLNVIVGSLPIGEGFEVNVGDANGFEFVAGAGVNLFGLISGSIVEKDSVFIRRLPDGSFGLTGEVYKIY